MGRVADLAIGLPRLLGRHPAARTGSSPRCSAPSGTRRTRSASGTYARRRDPHGRRPRQLAARSRASTAGTASTAARRTSSCPSLYCDNHSVAATAHDRRGLPPHRGSRRPRDRVPVRPAQRRPEQPFFLYFATGACHSPHQAPPEWIERYRGQFDDGWDALRRANARPPDRDGIMPARYRAVAATRVGAGVGRPRIRATRRSRRGSWSASPGSSRTPTTRSAACSTSSTVTGDLDDTIVMLVSDNGASAEGGVHGSINDVPLVEPRPAAGAEEMRARIDELGGPTMHNNYPWGWTMAGNTPFKRWKREVHEGGVADPLHRALAARYRGRRGELRRQFVHAIDVVPTILDAGRPSRRPTQLARGGAERRSRATSFAYLLARRRRRRAGAARHAVLRDARLPCDLSPGLEGGDVQVARLTAPDRTTSTRPSTRTCGSCTTWRRIRRRSTTAPTTNPNGSRRWSTSGGSEAERYKVLPLDNRILVHDPQPATEPTA